MPPKGPRMSSLPTTSELRRLFTFVITTCLLIGLLQGASISTSQFANAAAGDAGSLRTNSDAGIQFSNQATALTDAFTIEGWWKWETGASTSGNQLLLGGTGTPGIYTVGNSALRLTRWGGGYDSADCTLPAILTPGSWYHLAIGRSSAGSVTVWFNGIALPNCTNISVSPFISLSTQFPSKFGGNSAGTKFDGYVANYRATSTDIYGAATGNRFTPVASFYSLISGTVNLLNTPNDAATGFSDLVVSGSEFTSHAGGSLSADYPTYIEQSICFDGSQVKYLNIDSIGTTDFTLELWVKPTAWSNYMTFLSTKIDANGAYLGYNTNAGDHRILFYENGVGAGDTYVPENQWSHIAVVRSGINMKMYFNGNVVGENTNSTKNFSNPKLYVGSSYEASANNPNNFKGCMSSVRLVKSAVYTSPFTPAAKGLFAARPNATKSFVELTAVNGQVISSGTAGLLQGATGTLTFDNLVSTQSSLSVNSTSGTYGSTTLLTTSGGSGNGSVSYTVVSGNCSVVGDVLSNTSAGNCVITATKANDENYLSKTSAQLTITVNPLTLTAPLSVSATAIPNSSTSIKASYAASVNATSHSALVYLSNGTTLVTMVPNYESGTAISGLSANTAYKVAIKAIGDASNTNDSLNSIQASVSTNINYNWEIAYAAGLGAVGTLPESQIKLTGETFTVSSGSSLSKDGHAFLNWNSGPSSYSAGSTFTVGSVNETLTAQWTVNAYPIDFNANGGSSGGVVNVNYGSSALPSAPTVTRSDYSLAGWAETTTSSVLTSWTVVSEKTLYAIWSPKVYTISYSPESGTATTASETFTVLTMPGTWQIPTRSNYAFDGWYTDKTWSTLRGTGGSSFTPNETETVYAKWTQSSLVGLTSPTSFGNIIATPGNDGGISATRSGTRVEVDYFADSLPDNTVITAYLQGNTTRAASVLTGVSNLLLSVVVAWKAPDETVPDVNPAKNAIRMKITNADIKSGAKVYSIVNNTSTLLATATQDGFVVIELRVDPEIVIANPVEVPTPPSGGGGVAYTSTPSIDDPETLKAAEAKAAEELRIAREKAEAEIKAANYAAEIDAKLRAEEAARIAAKLKAEEDAALAAELVAQNFVPELTLYSITSKLKLSTFDTAYLTEYVSTLKKRATVTCIGYVYSKLTSMTKARALATSQATAVCKMIKAKRKTLVTRVQLLAASKAPKAAAGAKWVAVSYRVDGYKS